MKGIVCQTCGHVVLNGEAPDNCPVCMSPKDKFKEDEKAINEPKDADNLEELEKKHIPVLNFEEKCSIDEDDCSYLHVKIGEIVHPMEDDHSILFADVYVDNNFVSRVHLTPNLYPFFGLHLKTKSGKVSVVELCNKHGKWISEANL